MAVWSEVMLSDLAGARRLDAEYYQPAFFENAARIRATLRRGFSVERVADLVHNIKGSAFYPPLVEHYGETGTPFLRVSDLGEFFVKEDDLIRVEPSILKHYKTISHVDEGAIVIAKGGTIGLLSLVQPGLGRCAICRDVIAVEPDKDKINPIYLLLYLKARPGQFQLDRNKSQQVQAHLTFPAVGDIEVAIPSRKIQDQIAHLVHEGLQEFNAARKIYGEAEALLESALGLNKLDLKPRLFYERPYADVQTAARFDAEYFQPRMQNLIAALSRDGQTIEDVAKLSKRKFKATPGSSFQYIEISDVSGNGTVDSSVVASEEAPSRATWIVKPGEIITTTVRPIRRLSAIITDEQNGYVCSSGFAVLAPKDVAPELLLVYLRLPIVCELLDLHTTASMYPAISTADLMKIPVTLPKGAARQKIVAKVDESFQARREARRLLDEAKALVEHAILGE